MFPKSTRQNTLTVRNGAAGNSLFPEAETDFQAFILDTAQLAVRESITLKSTRDSIWLVDAGSLLLRYRSGSNRILQFSFPGEAIPLNMMPGTHDESNMTALEQTRLICIDLHRYLAHAECNPPIQQHFFSNLSQRMVRFQQFRSKLRFNNSAEHKIASLIAYWLEHKPYAHFIPLIASDIAAFLVLPISQVKTVLDALSAQGKIEATGFGLTLIDTETLASLSE